MKKILRENAIAFFLVIATLGLTLYLYQKGQISFLTSHRNSPKAENVVTEFLFTEKEYKLSYKSLPPESAVEVADFEENEAWQGDGEFDSLNFWEGKTSLSLTSQNNRVSSASFSLKEKFDISKISYFKLFVFLKSPLKNLEEANLIFKGGGGVSYKYPLMELSEGWNYLTLPRSMFSESSVVDNGESGEKEKIDSLTLELVSRPKTMSSLSFDFLTGEENDNYLSDWNTTDNRFLSLAKNGNTVNLLLVGYSGQIANLKKITAAKDYTFQARFIPQRRGAFGFFLRGDYQSGYGYYLTVGGEGTNIFSISKKGLFSGKEEEIELLKGKVSNMKMEEAPYWLKATLDGSKLSFYISMNGVDFSELGSINDSGISSGGVGLVAREGAFLLVDDIFFSQ